MDFGKHLSVRKLNKGLDHTYHGEHPLQLSWKAIRMVTGLA